MSRGRFKKPKRFTRSSIDDAAGELRDRIDREVPNSEIEVVKQRAAAIISSGAVVGFPEFAAKVSERLPKHCACWRPLFEIANVVMSRSESGHRLAVLLATGASFNAFNATILLALNGLGSDAMVMCRSLLETAMGAVYLAANPAKTNDYVDYAKVIMYKIAKRWESGTREDLIAITQAESKEVENRFPKQHKSWHQLSNYELANNVGFGDVYNDYYTLSSSVSHGDFLAVTARMSPGSGFQPPPAWPFVEDALELAAEIAFRLFNSVGRLLYLDYAPQLHEVLAILEAIAPKRSGARRVVPEAEGTRTTEQPESPPASIS